MQASAKPCLSSAYLDCAQAKVLAWVSLGRLILNDFEIQDGGHMLFWNKFLMVITCCCCLDKYPRMCKSSINILNLGVFFKQLALSWFSRYFSFDMEVKLDCCHKHFLAKD